MLIALVGNSATVARPLHWGLEESDSATKKTIA
jgi:hypothetical protein